MTPRDVGFWQGIMEVAHGRGQLRLILQPLVSIILGARLGIADAKQGKDPFLMRLFVTSPDRRLLAKTAATDVLIPFLVAIVLDGVLQYFTLGYVRPLAAVVVGAVLIWVPYSLARAFANRIYRHLHGPAPAASP
ncbi:MAG: hypothetical protein JWO36_4387 [Myxococcales bacterium]|nr:hypothetical protein [Myxococcales bacterium]